jgi:serine phosphatase RsbU (regulator of sigma subunit)
MDLLQPGHEDAPPAHPTLDVVLIEDDIGDAFLVQELLREADPHLETVWYRSFAEAAPHLGATTGCVLLDLHLPDTDGLDGLVGVLRLAPRASVVVLTGLVDQDQGLRAVAAGAQDYLIKGEADGPLLARSIRYALERRRADDAARTAYEAELRSQENARLERGLLPRPVLHDARLGCVVRYRPGGRRMLLGGDFYDAVETSDGVLHVMIGDVCGHGPDEAALGVSLRIAWRALVLAGHPPDHVMTILDDVLVHERAEAGVFVTLCDLAIAPDRSTALLSVAGHPGPLLLRPALAEVPVAARGPALGLVPDGRWPMSQISLPPGWTLMLYTDGLVEGRVPNSTERLGTDGLLGLLAPIHDHDDLHDIAEVLIGGVESLHGGPLPDDVALLLVSHQPDGAGRGSGGARTVS